MAKNNNKITPEIESKIRELAQKGLNASNIAQQIGCMTNNTVKKWADRLGIKLPQRKQGDINLKEKFDEFERLIRSGTPMKEARRLAKVGGSSAYKIIKERNLESFIRTKQEAALEIRTLTLEEAQLRLPPKSGKIIGMERKEGSARLYYKVIADDGFIYYKYPEALYQGDPRGKSGTPLQLQEIKDELFKIGYEYLEGWVNTRTSFKAIHIKCGYIRDTKLSCFSEESCPHCNPRGVSKQEIEVRDWVESLGFSTEKYKLPSIKTSCRTLDIHVPEKKLAIEYNGLWWHCLEQMKETRPNLSEVEVSRLHYDKMKMANEQGIRLITIFSHEWENKQFQVKNFIKATLGISEKTVYGRDTTVKIIDSKIAKDFIKMNHIQGTNNLAIVFFGLYLEDELLGVMSLGRHPRGGQKEIIVLDRLCFKDGILVHGGASKLFKMARKWAKTQGYSRIISWSDNRWSEGNVYEKMGFELDAELAPDFFYFRGNEVFSKQSLKKTKAEKVIGKTGKELRREEGYYTVYDCGKKRWVYNL